MMAPVPALPQAEIASHAGAIGACPSTQEGLSEQEGLYRQELQRAAALQAGLAGAQQGEAQARAAVQALEEGAARAAEQAAELQAQVLSRCCLAVVCRAPALLCCLWSWLMR
jgi:hypothetical protein